MKLKIAYLCMTVALGLGMTLGVLWLLGGSPLVVRADPGTLYVAPTGADSSNCINSANPCLTVQYAVDQAGADDDIRVATGAYTYTIARTPPLGYPNLPASGVITQVVYISETITVRGGYTATNWATSYPLTQPTTLDAESGKRGIFVGGTVTVTLENLRIIGGDATGLGGDPLLWDAGGGIALAGSDRATLSGNAIYSNTAGGGGGGVALAHPLPSHPNAPQDDEYCEAGIREEDETISHVQVGSIDNPSGYYTPTGYSDFTAHSTDMRVGVEYPITITLSASYSSDKGRIWVDWNQDENFDGPDERISMRVSSGKGPYYATIVPPAHASGGSTRMRVRMRYTNYPPECGYTNYGEIEDYTINVVPKSAPFYVHSAKTATVDYENWLITYTVAISNAGNMHGPGTYLTDTIPAGTTYVAGSVVTSTGVVTEGVGFIEWRGDVISGTTEYLTFTVSIDGAPLTHATITNTAHITHTDAPEWARPQHVLNISPPEFSGTKEGPTAAALNAPVTYTLNVRNDGGLPARNASLVDTFPSGVVGPAQNVNIDGPGQIIRNDLTELQWLGRLDPGQELTITFQLPPTSYCGQVLTNTVVITDPDAAAALTFTAPPMDVYQARLGEWDFEGDDGDFSGSGDWARGVPDYGPAEAHSGSELWGTVLSGNYSNDTTSVLTKTLDLSSVESALWSGGNGYTYMV